MTKLSEPILTFDGANQCVNANPFESITRIEVIDQNGREYVNTSVENVTIQIQDNSRTMKIFILNNNAK